MGSTGASSGNGWVIPNKFMYPLYWTALCDTAPGLGQSFIYQLFKLAVGSLVPIGPAVVVSGANTFTTGLVQPYGYVSRLDTLFIHVITSAGAAAANHRCMILMRY